MVCLQVHGRQYTDYSSTYTGVSVRQVLPLALPTPWNRLVDHPTHDQIEQQA